MTIDLSKFAITFLFFLRPCVDLYTPLFILEPNTFTVARFKKIGLILNSAEKPLAWADD